MAYFDIPVTYSSTGTPVDLKSKDAPKAGTHGKVALRVRDEPRIVTSKSKQEMAQHRDTIERIAKAFNML